MNLALFLTFLRIAFVPGIIILLFRPQQALLTAGLFALVCLTDALDGWVARKYHQVTNLGKFLDPLADKILATSVLMLLAYQGRVDILSVILLVVRDLSIDGLRNIAAAQGKVIAASRLAQWKTAVLMVAIIFLLAHWPAGHALYYLALVLALLSLLEYLLVNRKFLKN